MVSVLFADLVDFTTFSEHRDPEVVRDLLSRYFDRCRTLIERYGGVVEKFIGDAVMAVWGTPVAREDDAERAVRAALDLSGAVAALGAELGMPELRIRTGVLTGDAAVEVGAEGEGMVHGDSVNTASRLQALAEPGAVLVDTVTRRASEAAIAYEDAGTHEVKGRTQPVQAWRALRVVARVGGARRRAGPEAPLVGRDHVRQTLIGEFEATLGGQGARLVTLVGEAGLGKSRMAWELEKYVDGVRDQVLWHRGRSLSYGDGVAFWALAEMVRMRAGIGEEEGPETAASKLHETVERFVQAPAERHLVEPRLAALLGLERRASTDRADLFSGWRLFFERLSDHAPVAMVFEDMQWADSSLLEFVAYLREWSAARPIFMLSLSRPDMLEDIGGWDNGLGSTQIALEPLAEPEMEELLAALVPGAPAELRSKIAARADGIPLYATEIVRMLVDRGVLEQHEDRYELAAPVDELEVPETLQALIAARIDGLPARERRLLRDAAVLGLSFTEAGLVSVSDLPVSEVRAGVAGLVERQFVAQATDTMSPEHGQYVFMQALVRRVAYGTLARRERKQRHLRAAEHLRLAWGIEAAEVADVRAAHLLDAVKADPEASDAGAITSQARETLILAAERASGLTAAGRASELFAQAAGLAPQGSEQAQLLDRAMQAAIRDGDTARASEYGERAIEIWNSAGETRRAAVCSARLGRFLTGVSGRYSEELPRMQRAHEVVLASDERDAERAEITLTLASHMCEAGDYEAAWPYVDESLALAEELRLPEMISMGLNLKYLVRYTQGRLEEARALLLHSLLLAQEHDLPGREIRAHNNLGAMLINRFHNGEALAHLDEAGEIARRLGSRSDAWLVAGVKPLVLFHLGRWDEALELAQEMTAEEVGDRYSAVESAAGRCLILMARGEIEQAGADIERVDREPIEHAEFSAMKAAIRAALLRHTGDARGALELARSSMQSETRTVLDRWIQELRVQALEAMLELGQTESAAALVVELREIVARADVPYLDVQADRFAARIAALQAGPEAAGPLFRRAQSAFHEHEDPFHAAVVALEHAEALGEPADSETLLSEARATFERLGAIPWLRRARALQRAGVVA